MPEDLMRYDLITRQALRGVVRAALERVRKDGLPGEHHFYIAFDTNHPGAKLSDRLKHKYPEEMTVVLQHQFWGLVIRDDGFSVELSFDNIPEKLEVPFASIRGFFDPHVQFGLQFEVEKANQNDNSEEPADEAGTNPEIAIVAQAGAKKSDEDAAKAEHDAPREAEVSDGTEAVEAKREPDEKNDPVGKAKVVSLDSFRKQ